jgi:hypothetical protein
VAITAPGAGFGSVASGAPTGVAVARKMKT